MKRAFALFLCFVELAFLFLFSELAGGIGWPSFFSPRVEECDGRLT
jgi:hypothetical protein